MCINFALDYQGGAARATQLTELWEQVKFVRGKLFFFLTLIFYA